MKKQRKHAIIGGEGGIRTHGTVTRTTVFETVPFDLSGTSPCAHVACHFLGGNLCRFTNPPTKYLARAPSLSDGIFGECQVQGGEEAGCGWQNDQRTCLLDRLGDHDVGHQSEHGAAGYGFGNMVRSGNEPRMNSLPTAAASVPATRTVDQRPKIAAGRKPARREFRSRAHPRSEAYWPRCVTRCRLLLAIAAQLAAPGVPALKLLSARSWLSCSTARART